MNRSGRTETRTFVLAGIFAVLLAGSASTATAETYLGCGNRQDFQITARQRECFLDWPDLPLADAVDLKRIRWHTWGGRVAPAHAVIRTKTYDPWTYVRVLAYRRRDCGRGALYTRVRVTARDGSWSHTWRTMACRDVPVDR